MTTEWSFAIMKEKGLVDMEVSGSKKRILDEALKLFSINGYEATSIEQIVNAVGIRKASFYSHFKSKQELLDMLLEEIKAKYEAYSETVQKAWEIVELDCHKSNLQITETVFQFVKCQVEFLMDDSFFSMARNFFAIEQFRNPQLAFLQNKCEYIDALNYHKRLIHYLIENSFLVDKEEEIMAYEFFSPIYVQFYHMQRVPQCREEAMEIIKKHINHFFVMYCK